MQIIRSPTRRAGLIAACVPLMVLFLVWHYKIHLLVPAIATIPSQHSLVTSVASLARHKLFPWTAKQDKENEDAAMSNRTPFSRHIVAVGDLHGDMHNARKVLQFSGVVDEMGDWSGDIDYFVQTGDIIDRGDDTILLYTWMDKLRAQAHAAGGTVLSLLGNHEWMNAIGDWRYVYPSELKTFGTISARQRMLSSGRIGRSWAHNYTTAARLPLHPSLGPPNTPYPHPRHAVQFQKQADYDYEDDHEHGHKHHREHDHEREHHHGHKDKHHEHEHDHHQHKHHGHHHGKHHHKSKSKSNADTSPLSHSALSFVHGGLSPTYRDLTPFPSRINALASSLLHKLQSRPQPPPYPPNPYPGMPRDATDAEEALYDSNGPLWYRGWAQESDEVVCRDVDEVLSRTGTRRMIMGHTPHFSNIVSRCDGKIIIIDTGISHAYGGVLSALSIHYALRPVGDDVDKRWVERETVSALYLEHRVVIATSEREVVGDFDEEWDDDDDEDGDGEHGQWEHEREGLFAVV